jgi:kynurenine 3-monooxygenase
MKKKQTITIMGAGLVGSLMAILFAKRGYQVHMYERRPDMRQSGAYGGRSINLALSERGWSGLQKAGITSEVKKLAIPMFGRVMHDTAGNLSYQPYGKEGQAIYSVSRGGLNRLLIELAEKVGVRLYFDQRCTDVDLQSSHCRMEDARTGATYGLEAEILIGTDGAFSALRNALQKTDRFDYQQFYIEHGYKELTILPDALGNFALKEVEALHIWPRGHFMMIALPNPDKTFTCTLFFPFEGNPSFSSLNGEGAVMDFFQQVFPDAVPLMPTLLEDFNHNPTSSLVTVKCYPWAKGNALLLGDAAHAIVPFYGQGMNCGFEDCAVLDSLLEDDSLPLDKVFSEFQKLRKPNADAVAELALRNFIEMRDLVADPSFLLRKKIEARMNDLFGDRWVPLYSMVTFRPDIPYAHALEEGKRHDKVFAHFMDKLNPDTTYSQQAMDELARNIMDAVEQGASL